MKKVFIAFIHGSANEDFLTSPQIKPYFIINLNFRKLRILQREFIRFIVLHNKMHSLEENYNDLFSSVLMKVFVIELNC